MNRKAAALRHESRNTSSADRARENGELPMGWRRVAIKDMADSIQYGHTASAVERKNGPRFLRITDIQDGRVDWSAVPSCDIPDEDIPRYSLSSGDLVFARTGATTGKSFLIGDCPEAVFASYLIRVRVSAGVDSRYLAAFFLSPDYWRQIEGGKRGIGQPNVNGTVLGQVQFPLAPLPEQQRIVAEIEKQFTRLEAGVAALRRVQANLKRYRAAVLKAACEGRLVPTEVELARAESGEASFQSGEALLARILTKRRASWEGRGQYKEPAALPDTRLNSLPEGWAWTTLDALAAIKGGITKDQNRKPAAPTRSVPYLRVANVQRYHIDLTEVKEIIATEDEIEELMLKSGDILFNEGGDRDKLGRGWVWNDELPECIHQNHVFRARLYVEDLNPKLISWYANTFGQKFFFDEGKHTTNLASISMSKLKGLPVPIPPPAEQMRIVAEVDRRLSVIEELEATVSANLQRATHLRQSILQRAFSPTAAEGSDA
jgi:type I restriction enzyme S subunit